MAVLKSYLATDSDCPVSAILSATSRSTDALTETLGAWSVSMITAGADLVSVNLSGPMILVVLRVKLRTKPCRAGDRTFHRAEGGSHVSP